MIKNLINIFISCFLITSCNNTTISNDTNNKNYNESISIDTHTNIVPSVNVVEYEKLNNVFTQHNDTLLIVNFWATWCRPCIKELPYFEASYQSNKNNYPIKMIYVSLDMLDILDTGVKPFIIKQGMTGEYYLLNDNGRMNEWIPFFNKEWTGSIPATILYKNGKQLYFHEGQLNEIELNDLIKKYAI